MIWVSWSRLGLGMQHLVYIPGNKWNESLYLALLMTTLTAPAIVHSCSGLWVNRKLGLGFGPGCCQEGSYYY
jgi:hypothetical protein